MRLTETRLNVILNEAAGIVSSIRLIAEAIKHHDSPDDVILGACYDAESRFRLLTAKIIDEANK
jgi:hypothetical protein